MGDGMPEGFLGEEDPWWSDSAKKISEESESSPPLQRQMPNAAGENITTTTVSPPEESTPMSEILTGAEGEEDEKPSASLLLAAAAWTAVLGVAAARAGMARRENLAASVAKSTLHVCLGINIDSFSLLFSLRFGESEGSLIFWAVGFCFAAGAEGGNAFIGLPSSSSDLADVSTDAQAEFFLLVRNLPKNKSYFLTFLFLITSSWRPACSPPCC